MKKIYWILICVLFTSFLGCSNSDEPEIPTEPPVITPPVAIGDSVTVSFKFTGDVDFCTSPMSRVAQSADDLYGLQVYTMNTGTSYNINTYAYGYFDNVDDIKVRLSGIQKYGFTLTYIPNGKNIIYKYPDGHYGRPFASLFHESYNGAINTIRYSTTAGLDQLGSCAAQTTSSYKEGNSLVEVERYQGAVGYVDPRKTNIIEIPLYKQMYGLKIVAKDFTEGSIHIKTFDGTTKGPIYPETNTTTTEHSWIFQLPYMPDCYDAVNGEPRQEVNLGIYYRDNDGNETPLFSKMITVERNVMHTFTFSVGDILYGGVKPTYKEDGEMQEKEQLKQ